VHRSLQPFAIALLALAAGGCLRDHIEITIEPQPDGSFVRSLRMWRVDDAKPKDIKAPSQEFVKAARPHYMAPVDTPDATVAFRNTFYKLPSDIAFQDRRNAGGYVVVTGSFGRVGHYRERRPGRTDHAAAQQEIRSAVETLTSLLATIVRQQLQGEEGAERLAAAVEGPFRRDLQDLALAVAAIGATGQPVTLEKDIEKDKETRDRFFAIVSYVLQFVEERGYVKAREALRFTDGDAVREHVLRLVAKHMGRPLDADLRAKLLAVTEGEVWEAAGKRALEAMNLTEEELKKTLEPLAALAVIKAVGTDPLLHYALALPEGAELVSSNGRLDAEARKVRWTDELDGRLVAQLFHALWATPDTDARRQRLGRQALQGSKLMRFTLWENTLSPERRARWTAAVARLDPKGDLPAQLNAIRIAEGEDGDEPAGVAILLDALGAAQEKQ